MNLYKEGKKMKKLFLALFLAVGITSANAVEVLDGNLTGNMTITSNYEFRGISLSQNGPAIQGGIDYNHKTGLYIGNWNSSFRNVPNLGDDDVDANSGIQMNVYAGWKGEYKGVRGGLGYITYNYPTASTSGGYPAGNYNTGEVFAHLGYGPVEVKYSQTTSNYFGQSNSTGSNYMEANVKQDLGILASQLKNLSIVAHYGHTNVANHSNLNYNDMNAGLVYSFPGQWDLGVKYYTNSSMTSTFQKANSWNGTKYYGNAVVASVTKTFD
jgi:uncharacterized protein (TIGR02001 family)